MTVGLLIVSHSSKIAEGVCELAGQMAADVSIVAAGGTDDGGIGTSFAKVEQGLAAAQSGSGVLVLTDLGSAVLIAELVLEFLSDGDRADVRVLPEAPLVEGSVAAAVAAQSGADLQTVLRAAADAIPAAAQKAPSEEPARGDTTTGAPAAADREAAGEAELINPMGLHARPAAALAQAMAGMDAEVRINGVNAKSVMLLMTLGLQQGQTLSVQATGPDARAAVEFVLSAARDGFGEM